MRQWDLSKKAEWDYTGCVVRGDDYKTAYVTGRKEYPHGTFWIGYYYGNCKCWCSRNIRDVFADSKEDYELYRKGQLTPDINPNGLEQVAAFEKWRKSLNPVSRFVYGLKHFFEYYEVDEDRIRDISCETCGHHFNGGIYIHGAWNDMGQLRRPNVTCPYCGETDQKKIMWWG